MPAIIDIETNKLILPDRVHCAVLIDIDTAKPEEYANARGYAPMTKFIARVQGIIDRGDHLIGHNSCSYDVPQLRRLYRLRVTGTALLDTLHATRIRWPDLREYDAQQAVLPAKLHNKHSLKAWGMRLGVLKSDFGETTDWRQFTPEMMAYCVQDCIVTAALYMHILDNADD